MKKTLTLFAMLAMISSATFAQHNQPGNRDYDNNRNRDVVVNNDRDRGGPGYGKGTYYFTAREKDMAINSINRDYFRKMESVKNKFFVNRYKKEQKIYSLQIQRDAELRSVIEKFNDRRNQANRRDQRFDKYDNKGRW